MGYRVLYRTYTEITQSVTLSVHYSAMIGCVLKYRSIYMHMDMNIVQIRNPMARPAAQAHDT
jgi:hypothetical protein